MAINVNTYTKHDWVDNSSPDLEAEILNEIETGIGDNNDAIKAIAAAVVSQIVNDPDKIASMAALYAVNQALGSLSTTVTNINSNLLKVKNGNLDIVTTTNYVGEYQGTIGIAAIISAFNLSDKTILTVICRGGTLVTDGSVMPKYLANDNGCVFSGPVSGTYRMEFCVFYK